MNQVVISPAESLTIRLDFKRSTDFKAIRQLEFSSRLLSALKPDKNNVWVPGKRSDFHFVGFPPSITWTFPEENTMVGTLEKGSSLKPKDFVNDLNYAIEGLCPEREESATPIYRFAISDGKTRFEYSFHSRARTICALAVLYDLDWHPRKDLEIWINPDLTDKLVPGAEVDHNKSPEQYYGDPSKTADVLRNEGWTREAADPFMFVEPRNINGQSQQHYRISQRDQPLDTQVKRSNIKPRWRNMLFERDRFTCQICMASYPGQLDYLSPDHRIPVVFEADNLTDENFLGKLVTLCRFCNQAKREFTKRVPFNYDWKTSPWSYPEKYRIQIIARQLNELKAQSGESLDSLLSEIRRLTS